MKKFISLTIILVILDQITKFLLQNKEYGTSFIKFTYLENTGAAFGLFQNFNIIFIIISFLVLGFTIYYFKQYPLPLSLVIAGILGNLIDRLFFGFVRDFISISIWPVFNLADTFNTIGVIILAYYFYKEDKTYKPKTLSNK